jgi:hypothetical protein
MTAIREFEHTITAAGAEVGVPEGGVGIDREPLKDRATATYPASVTLWPQFVKGWGIPRRIEDEHFVAA